MSSSLKSVKNILSTIPKLSEWLIQADNYLAHTKKDYPSEKLEEHINLVNHYFAKLCSEHQLDQIIDKLIIDLVKIHFSVDKHEIVCNFIKTAFVHVIHFHDFGKVNLNFQSSPEKMNNKLFGFIPNYSLSTHHSSLGAYLFVVKHIQDTLPLKLPTEEKAKLYLVILLLSYSINKHHAAELADPVGKDICFNENVKEMKEYIKSYQFDIHPFIQQDLLTGLRDKNNLFENYYKIADEVDFTFFALIKLNFSLLTAADYLATHEYMSDAETDDMGVFKDRARITSIIDHFRKYKHNKNVFAQLDAFQFKHPVEMSMDNLNQLRKEMAVELIWTIRQNIDQHLFYIEAPTGGGKTNLSMIALTELLENNPEISKVFYVFPYTTLITQTYQVLSTALGLKSDELVQLHSKAGFHSKREELKDGEYGDEKKDFIDQMFSLYPVSVLSHVKFFDILKSNKKESNYLLHRLANSVVIIDEIQTYNPAIWDRMLYNIKYYAEYFNIRFVLMSATLPKIDNLKFDFRTSVKFIDLLPNSKKYLQNPNFAQRVNFKFDLHKKDISLDQLAEHVIGTSQKYSKKNVGYNSVHTIVEFIYKKSATTFYDIINKQQNCFDYIFVLSGTILEYRRKFIINFLKNKENRDKNILLITTQVVEAGVDIDMDLGYKNVSLIDSDEQLAGRVNRNADKKDCEVYLFDIDEARILYKQDERYKVTRDKIKDEEYAEILKEKNFCKLYDLVFERIDDLNYKKQIQNFITEYIENGIQKVNFRKIDEEFKIIDQKNESVYVPISLPIFIEGIESSEMEQLFSTEDLKFLERFGVYKDGDTDIDGEQVWNIYSDLIERKKSIKKEKSFDLKEKIDFKILQSILSKFTFSLFSNPKLIIKLKSFCRNGDHTYGYLYLSHLDKYCKESGLLESKFDETENYFL